MKPLENIEPTFLVINIMSNHKYSVPIFRYILPPYLQGILTQRQYSQLLDHEASTLKALDRSRKAPCLAGSKGQGYELAIHTAFQNGSLYDPYTGEKMRWDLLTKNQKKT